MTDSYIEFRHLGKSDSGKTDIWTIVPKDAPAATRILGEVRWFGRWRCYSFYPNPGTVYERACLRDIATFCEDQTKARR